MLQITCVISFFRGISHENHQNGSVPWCYKWQVLSPFFMVFPMKFIKTAQYHDATNDMLYLNFSMVFPMNFAKTAQYHDATNDTRYLIFPWYVTWNSPKRLSTTILQMTKVISIFHGNSHGIHQSSSVPQCYKWRALSPFFSWYFPCNPPTRLSTMMLQITRVI